ncbi:hypothetical protein J2Z66_008431 [Paenibacillus eucommiae]|uniref:Uncharacterized protein n=1 Tax=Paenibacillus eucommiae TaxID=1355755 RepID=A0ABS4JAC5_9BACL|nr:hypothetical protein [Paenibacillus eucommiae]
MVSFYQLNLGELAIDNFTYDVNRSAYEQPG